MNFAKINFLVNFDYLTRTLENYGFVPIKDSEAQAIGFPSGIGSFSELFDIMENEISNKRIKQINTGSAINMTVQEKRISFLNNYFIYKKIRNPDAKDLSQKLAGITEEQLKLSKAESKDLETSTKQQVLPKRNIKKFKKRLILPK